MTKPFHELRECLLLAGIAPRYVRRYLNELTDHLADLTTEELHAGRRRTEAEAAALLRLGDIDDLANAITAQRQFQSWSSRAPWAAFGLAPLVLLAGVWFLALLLLWSGWQIFPPGADTPFGSRPGPHRIFDLANVYFQIDRALYFGAPILIGWGLGLVAARQRLKTGWPAVGLVLIALVADMAQVRASRTTVPDGIRHISMNFALGPSVQGISAGLLHALVIRSITVLPYLIWRLQKARSLSA